MSSEADDRWGGSVALTSNYLLRGISQTGGSGALQGDLHYHTPGGWVAGLWASSIELNPEDGKTAEINGYAGYAWRIAPDWSAQLSANHYAYPWNQPPRFYDYDELVAGAAYRDLVFASASFSPNTSQESALGTSRSHTATSYELALRWPLQGTLAALAGIGHYALSGSHGGGYWYWSTGVGYDFEPWHLDISYFGTSAGARVFSNEDISPDHWAATIMWRF